jgi:hypothetical protein
VMFGKFVWCSEKFWYVRKIFGPLKWYTEGGGRSPKLIVTEKKIFGSGRAQSEKVGHISFRPPNFFLPVRPWWHTKGKALGTRLGDICCKLITNI